jgi:hypothetical protein
MSKSSSCSYQFRTIINHGEYDDRPAKVGRSHFFNLPPRSLKPISDEIILKYYRITTEAFLVPPLRGSNALKRAHPQIIE